MPISVAIAGPVGDRHPLRPQTVRAYQTSGGAYVVAQGQSRDVPEPRRGGGAARGLRAHGGRLGGGRDLALTSVAPSLAPHTVALSLGSVALLTLVNLRGVRESGIPFAIPTYAFVAAMYALRRDREWGKCAPGTCPHGAGSESRRRGRRDGGGVSSSFGLLLRAPAALTGVEAISNGVAAFRPPERSQNAATTLAILGCDLDHALPWRLVSRRGGRPAERTRLAPLRDRPRLLPGPSSVGFMYFVVQVRRSRS